MAVYVYEFLYVDINNRNIIYFFRNLLVFNDDCSMEVADVLMEETIDMITSGLKYCGQLLLLLIYGLSFFVPENKRL